MSEVTLVNKNEKLRSVSVWVKDGLIESDMVPVESGGTA
jgi:hypothetical protein